MGGNEYGLALSDFQALGDHAEAGLLVTTLALGRARRSNDQARIPIAGATVVRRADATLDVVTVGNNGRIPPLGMYSADDPSFPNGYPTDHGETSAIRVAGDVSAVDWKNAVFATTLSPCIMCARSITYLHSLGLTRVVIAEAKSFPGKKDMLAALPGMVMVELTNAYAVEMMKTVSRRYPWDWAADIGEVPPGRPEYAAGLEGDAARREALLARVFALHDSGTVAALIGPDDSGADIVLGSGGDTRAAHGGNPCMSAVMVAIGSAGSAANIRESVVVFHTGADQVVGIGEFGHASLGACELFRPAAVLSNNPFDAELTRLLDAAGVRILTG